MSAKELWRSKTMQYCTITVQRDMSYEVLQALLKHRTVQFVDQNENIPAFQRHFSRNVQKIYDTEQKLSYLRSVIELSDVKIPDQIANPDSTSIMILDQQLDTVISEYKTLNIDYQLNKQNYQDLQELIMVIEKLHKIDQASRALNSIKMQTNQESEELTGIHSVSEYVEQNIMYVAKNVGQQDNDIKLVRIVFTVPRRLTMQLLKIIFKITYSNVYYEYTPLNDDKEPFNDFDLVCIYVTGQEVLNRCTKSITAFNCRIFGLDSNIIHQRVSTLNELKNYQLSLQMSEQRLNKILLNAVQYVDSWHQMVFEQKQIAHTKNMFSLNEDIMQCSCWVPEECVGEVRDAIYEADSKFNSGVKTQLVMQQANTKQKPPTYFKTDKFTNVFQNIVNSYGCPSYKEINPAFFYLYQFPFTYSMMFGDIGHGVINSIISLLMIVKEKQLSKVRNDMFSLIFMGRYVIFMMSCFSIVTGLIYNDFFAMGYNCFFTNYKWQLKSGTTYTAPFTKVYPFGIDPLWHWADNSMIFLNSYKMKLSVVIGVSQMIFGLIIKLINMISRKDITNIFCVWIPEFFFMFSFFGYMIFTIIYKWLNFWPENSNPPALINMLIQIFLSPGSIDKNNQLFNNIQIQEKLQMAVFAVAVVSILWLMIAEPVAFAVHKKKLGAAEERTFSDVIVQQVIHTIEYVLGCISHTASYLRLWALSLAHSQLAEVFLDQILGISINLKMGGKTTTTIIGGLSLILTYGAWFGVTIAVINLMEALSAFLHCLRLSWIEFNSKFFAAEGYFFEPFGVDITPSIAITAQVARSN